MSSVDDLRSRIARGMQDWSAFHDLMAGGLLGAQDLSVTRIRRMGRFTLSRFVPAFDPDGENHIGETITDQSGRLAYLKTFRLSAAQTRRGYPLANLAVHGWNLDATAAALGTDRAAVKARLDHAGFGHLLRPGV